MTTTLLPPAPPGSVPAPRRWTRGHLLLALGAALLVLIGLGQAKERYDDHLRREPLRAAHLAAARTDQPIRVVGEALLTRWVEGRPSERTIAESVGPGNGYLAAVVDGSDLGHPLDGQTCYYLAAGPGRDFDPERVSGLGRICYLDGELYGTGYIAVVGLG